MRILPFSFPSSSAEVFSSIKHIFFVKILLWHGVADVDFYAQARWIQAVFFLCFSNISKSEFSVVEMRDFGSFSFALRGLCAPLGSLNHPWEHYFDW